RISLGKEQKPILVLLDAIRHHVVDEVRNSTVADNLFCIVLYTPRPILLHVIKVMGQFTERCVLDLLISEWVNRQSKKAVRLLGVSFPPCAEQDQVFADKHAGESCLQRTPIVNLDHILKQQLPMLVVSLKDNPPLIAL